MLKSLWRRSFQTLLLQAGQSFDVTETSGILWRTFGTGPWSTIVFSPIISFAPSTLITVPFLHNFIMSSSLDERKVTKGVRSDLDVQVLRKRDDFAPDSIAAASRDESRDLQSSHQGGLVAPSTTPGTAPFSDRPEQDRVRYDNSALSRLLGGVGRRLGLYGGVSAEGGAKRVRQPVGLDDEEEEEPLGDGIMYGTEWEFYSHPNNYPVRVHDRDIHCSVKSLGNSQTRGPEVPDETKSNH